MKCGGWMTTAAASPAGWGAVCMSELLPVRNFTYIQTCPRILWLRLLNLRWNNVIGVWGFFSLNT